MFILFLEKKRNYIIITVGVFMVKFVCARMKASLTNVFEKIK